MKKRTAPTTSTSAPITPYTTTSLLPVGSIDGCGVRFVCWGGMICVGEMFLAITVVVGVATGCVGIAVGLDVGSGVLVGSGVVGVGVLLTDFFTGDGVFDG